jgi:hypothetical protein
LHNSKRPLIFVSLINNKTTTAMYNENIKYFQSDEVEMLGFKETAMWAPGFAPSQSHLSLAERIDICARELGPKVGTEIEVVEYSDHYKGVVMGVCNNYVVVAVVKS